MWAMELDAAYTLHLDIVTERRRPVRSWNRGLSWDAQGVPQEEQERRRGILRKHSFPKGHVGGRPPKENPVIQMDESGERLHWYRSSEAAARKTGCSGRNIRKVCDGERKHAGGYRWRWDERFV